mmetsp:Transcript_4097/g.9373  ORF Transcript_4097/g.9373 Transcript_4097/m.9373 type:complete len:80 (+) Transcript_4097:532-771(+)
MAPCRPQRQGRIRERDVCYVGHFREVLCSLIHQQSLNHVCCWLSLSVSRPMDSNSSIASVCVCHDYEQVCLAFSLQEAQ